MEKHRVVWSIKLEKTVDANSFDKAREIIENVDCQHDGSYVSDSFEHIGVERVDQMEMIVEGLDKLKKPKSKWICGNCGTANDRHFQRV